MEAGFDYHELTDFQKELIQMAKEDFPRETRKFIKREAGKLTRMAKSSAERELNSKTGDYIKGFKSGKIYKFAGDLCCRAFNSSPHAHLIEYGHNMVGHKPNLKNVGFVAGKYILNKATNRFDKDFEGHLDKFLDDILDKGIK